MKIEYNKQWNNTRVSPCNWLTTKTTHTLLSSIKGATTTKQQRTITTTGITIIASCTYLMIILRGCCSTTTTTTATRTYYFNSLPTILIHGFKLNNNNNKYNIVRSLTFHHTNTYNRQQFTRTTITRTITKSLSSSSLLSFINTKKKHTLLLFANRKEVLHSSQFRSVPFYNQLNNNNNKVQSSSSTSTTAASSSITRNNEIDISMDTSNENVSTALRFIDIGANLLDDRFTKGIYHGTYRHEPDIMDVIERAQNVGITKLIITAGTVEESSAAVQAVRQLRKDFNSTSTTNIQFACTVGIHPTRCQEVFIDSFLQDSKGCSNQDEYDSMIIQQLVSIAIDGMIDNTVIAIGEIGLDYDRLQFTAKDIQLKYFSKQLQILAKETKLPLFLHNRNVTTDLFTILKDNYNCWNHKNTSTNDSSSSSIGGGVVHSFDDTIDLAMKFINELNLYIGLNGCSLRTEDNIKTISQIPLSRILLETDCPYCDIRSTHTGYKYLDTTKNHFTNDTVKSEKKFIHGKIIKNRQEPCHIIHIAEIIAKCHNVTIQHVSDVTYNNTINLFFSNTTSSDNANIL